MSRRASGLRAWMLQRLSAVYLALFTLVLLAYLRWQPPADFNAWCNWIAQPWVSIGLYLYVIILLLHVWVGIRDVLMDYVPAIAARVTLLSLFALLLTGSGLWALQAVFLTHSIH